MYSFLFDRRSMALLLTGMAAAGLLLFAGGVFVGLQLQLDSSSPATVAQFRPLAPTPAPSSAFAAVPAPTETPKSETPTSETPASEAPTSEETEPAAQPALMAPADPPGVPSWAAQPETALTAEAQPERETLLPEQELVLAVAPSAEEPVRPAVLTDPGGVPRAVQASLPAPASRLAPDSAPGSAPGGAPGPATAPVFDTVDESVPVLSHRDLATSAGEPTFGVQVAAFELHSTASRIAAEFTRRGWDTYLVPFETPSGRQMYSIRFGRFTDSGAAYRAARDFEQRAKAPALVRLQLQVD